MARVDWTVWGNVNVRQVPLYPSMRWALEGGLSSHMVAAAPYGGPLALTRDTRKLGFRNLMGGDDDGITIYSASGEYLSRIERAEEGGRLLHLGWSSKEYLYCVYEGGQVKVCVWGRAAMAAPWGQFSPPPLCAPPADALPFLSFPACAGTPSWAQTRAPLSSLRGCPVSAW